MCIGDTKFKLAKLRMEKLGYAVAKFANDGFALLRGDRMLAGSKPSPGGSGGVDLAMRTSGSSDSSSQVGTGVVQQQDQNVLVAAPTTDVALSSIEMRGPPEDEDPDPE